MQKYERYMEKENLRGRRVNPLQHIYSSMTKIHLNQYPAIAFQDALELIYMVQELTHQQIIVINLSAGAVQNYLHR